MINSAFAWEYLNFNMDSTGISVFLNFFLPYYKNEETRVFYK